MMFAHWLKRPILMLRTNSSSWLPTGHNTGPDWPKLGPSMLIATALVVAIRTARWAAKAPGAGLSDVDPELDREVDFAVRVADRVLHALLKKHPGMFPQRRDPIFAPDEESPP
jgi:hypothetical protein